MLTTSNLALRFLLEHAGLTALAYAGHQSGEGATRWLAAIAAPLLLALFWAFVVAPNATNPIAPSIREVLGSVALLGAAVALAFSGQARLATVFGILVVVNNIFLVLARDGAAAAEPVR